MKNKAFTLIELLAVIIILGILMLIAIPSVTNYINNSRKETYVDTIKEVIKGAVNRVNQGDMDLFDENKTYYIPCSCINTENTLQSPYGKLDPAYVVVTYDGNGYNYYFTGKDAGNMGVPTLTKSELLSKESIVSTETISTDVGISGTNTIAIFNSNCTEVATTKPVTETVSGNDGISGGSNLNNCTIEYPDTKDKSSVIVGDIVTICDEEFYVIKHDGTDLVMLSHYNLKVGDIYDSSNTKTGEYSESDEGYGLQSSEVKGYISGASTYNGTVSFSSTNYWSGRLNYPGDYCHANNYTEGKECPVVYDSNSNLYQYVENYKSYFERRGVQIKEARLLKFVEAIDLGCRYSCSGAQPFMKETSFWLGSPIDQFGIWRVRTQTDFDDSTYSNANSFGVRPVIVI